MNTFERTHPRLTAHVCKIVKSYKDLFPDEYKAVVEQIRANREKLRDEELGSVKGTHVIERAIAEFPETLWAALSSKLSVEDFMTFNSIDAQRWFATKFHEFRIPKKV